MTLSLLAPESTNSCGHFTQFLTSTSTLPPLCDFNFEQVPVFANSDNSCYLSSTFACRIASCLIDSIVVLDTEDCGGLTLGLEISVTVSVGFCDFLILLLSEVFLHFFPSIFSSLFPKLSSCVSIWTLMAKVKVQSWGFTSRSTARVILGQVLSIATCGTRTHRGDSL